MTSRTDQKAASVTAGAIDWVQLKWIAFLATGSALTPSLHALEAKDVFAFKLGPLQLRPSAAVAETFHDNVTYKSAPLGPEHDFITTLSPELKVIYGRQEEEDPWTFTVPKESNFVLADYKLDQHLYALHNVLNSADQNVRFALRLADDRISLAGSDQIQFIRGVLGGGYGYYDPIDRTLFRDSYTLRYAFTERTRAYVRGTHETTLFSSKQFYNDNSLTGLSGFEWQATPKSALFGELYYGQRALDPNGILKKSPHQTVVGGFVGLRGDYSERLRTTVKAGYEYREFSDTSPPDSSPVVDATLRYKIGQKTMATLEYNLSSGISVQTIRSAYTSDNFNLTIDQRLGSANKWLLSAGGGYSQSAYQSTGGMANRKDDSFHASFLASYVIKLWMTASFGYEFQKFSSSYPQNPAGILDYEANIVSIRFSVGY